MRRFVQRWMATAVLSASIVATAVGASYGGGTDVSLSSSPSRDTGSLGETTGRH